MRKFLIGIAASVFISGTITIAQAAGPEDLNNPQARAYINLAFGGYDKQDTLANSLHYGLRLDHSAQSSYNVAMLPPISQADFNISGFNNLSVNGVPFMQRSLKLNEDGSTTSYTVLDFGLLAAGVAGLGFAIYEVTKSKASPNPVTKTTTVSTANGNVVVTTVNGVVTSVVNVVNGVAADAGIQLSTITGPLLSAICSATGAIGGLACPTLGGNDGALSAAFEERDTKHLEWLNSENGHMGDLHLIQ